MNNKTVEKNKSDDLMTLFLAHWCKNYNSNIIKQTNKQTFNKK